jgi:uncharacterized phage-like protein YoqJ
MIVVGTGHRDLRDRDWIAGQIERSLIDMGTSLLYVGMASGADLLMAKTAYNLGIPFIAAKPWAGHKPRQSDVYDYGRALKFAYKVVDVTEYDDYPGAWVYDERNRYMVDHSQKVLAILESGRRGGTFNCLNYAKRKKLSGTVIDPLMKEVNSFEA